MINILLELPPTIVALVQQEQGMKRRVIALLLWLVRLTHQADYSNVLS
jgi:hypothetical protein